MGWARDIYRTTVGKKAVMAVSGIVLLGFVLGHMAGNLKLFQGAEKLNAYAEWLREIGSPALPHNAFLWIFRAVLLVAAALHILSAIEVSRANRAARPVRYKMNTRVQADYASRTMLWGGVIILLFLLYHLAHFTFGPAWAHPDFIYGDVYHNVVSGFQVWYVSAFYIVAQVALGLHIFHGAWSLFQSLGWNHPGYNSWRRRFAAAFALVITVGNISMPLAVLFGIVK